MFGSAQTVAAALKQTQGANQSVARQAAFYVYTGDDRGASERGLQSLCGNTDLLLRQAPAGNLSVRVSRDLADVAGPMAGLEFSSRLRRKTAFWLARSVENRDLRLSSRPEALRCSFGSSSSGIPVFFCASSHMVDIDQAVGPGFYDVKDHFCSVVPLVMFVRLMFPDVAWRPQELGACLIIDDPLLRQRYGSCDFGMLRDLMRRYGFTTNVAFIPWNWRRTSPHCRRIVQKRVRTFLRINSWL